MRDRVRHGGEYAWVGWACQLPALAPVSPFVAAPPTSTASARLATLSWAFLVYTVAVVLWGAFVRLSLSGDGCGAHWPLCNGEIVPVAPSRKTLIEFTHRITSGLCWFGVVALYFAARRRFAAGHPARRAFAWGVLFMSTEALIGAGLVLLRMVADNPAVARAYWMAAHLSNTFLLLLSLAWAAWACSGRPLLAGARHSNPVRLVFVVLAGTLLVGMSGAIAALGDTLFPAVSLQHALTQDFSPSAHVFLKLRVGHPILAVLVAGFSISVVWGIARSRITAVATRLGFAIVGLLGLQVVLGFVNVALLAPAWMQLLHLLVADVLWISLALLIPALLTDDAGAAPAQVQATTPRT